MFPGHGSAYKSMATKLIAKYQSAKDKFAFLLKFYPDIAYYTDVNADDNDTTLPSTLSAQLALYAMSCCVYDLMISEKNTHADYVIGHSLGGYAALYASRLITFEQGINIIIMQNKYIDDIHAQLEKTGMIACITNQNSQQQFESFVQTLQQVCYETNIAFQHTYICEIANYNSYKQIVLSGHNIALEYAANTLSQQYNIKTIPLKTEYAYHSSLMQSAAINLEQYLLNNIFNITNDKPILSHLSHTTTGPYPTLVINSSEQCLAISNNGSRIDVKLLSQLLSSQLYKAVYWIQTIDTLIDAEITHFYELGPKNILQSLLMQHPAANALEIFAIDDV